MSSFWLFIIPNLIWGLINVHCVILIIISLLKNSQASNYLAMSVFIYNWIFRFIYSSKCFRVRVHVWWMKFPAQLIHKCLQHYIIFKNACHDLMGTSECYILQTIAVTILKCELGSEIGSEIYDLEIV